VFASELDNAVCMWDAATGQELRRFVIQETARKYQNQVAGLGLSLDGKTLAATCVQTDKGQQYGLYVAWDVDTGKELRRWQQPLADVFRWTFSPDARLLALPDKSGVSIRDAATATQMLSLDGRCTEVEQVAFSPDGRTLAGICIHRRPVTGYYCTLAVWELATGQAIYRLPVETHGFRLAFSRDGRILVIGPSSAAPIQLWDLATGKALHPLAGQGAFVNALAFSPTALD
jgi:WD40 repeat protein